MKKNAPTVDTLGLMMDQEIKVLAQSAEEENQQPMADTSAQDISPQEMALLAISHDIGALLRLLKETKQRVDQFETYARSLEAQIKMLIKPYGN